jgi:hypothetical protein
MASSIPDLLNICLIAVLMVSLCIAPQLENFKITVDNRRLHSLTWEMGF